MTDDELRKKIESLENLLMQDSIVARLQEILYELATRSPARASDAVRRPVDAKDTEV